MWSARRYDQMCRVAADFQRGVGTRLQLLLTARTERMKGAHPRPGLGFTARARLHRDRMGSPAKNGLTLCAHLRAGLGAREGVAPLRSSHVVPCEYPLSTP
jgi:hypothetical protein